MAVTRRTRDGSQRKAETHDVKLEASKKQSVRRTPVILDSLVYVCMYTLYMYTERERERESLPQDDP